MHDIANIGRRAVLIGVASAGALGATSALAQIPNLGGMMGGAMGGAGNANLAKMGDLVGQVSNVIAGMNLTEADEIAMGGAYYDRFIDQSGGLYNDRAAQTALRKFAEPLIGTSKRSGLPWEITLLDNETVNAWALPSGKLGVHKGLIRYVATPEELAAVISHEIGHAELSHGIAQIKNKKFVSGMGGIAKQQIVEKVGRGKTGAIGAFMTNEVLTAFEGPIYDMITSGYSQDLEYAADGHIMGVFDSVGYDNARATIFYNTMLRLVPPGTKTTTSLYATHPGTKDRIKRLQKLIAADKTPAAASASHPGWAELKRSFPTRTHFRLA
ncbi:MAG: yfgC 2 [Phenylobacterium sp.]|nr:yfgC 2 [Phenylobacterium sp.]